MLLKPASHAALAAFFNTLKLFAMGYSWGGYESLIVPSKPHRSAGSLDTGGTLIRIHAGLEDLDDLTKDLESGLAAMGTAG